MNTYEIQQNLTRLVPRLNLKGVNKSDRVAFINRLETLLPTIFETLYAVYGDRYDFYYHLEATLQVAADAYRDRNKTLKKVDKEREANPLWFQSEQMVGMQLYVDLFAGDLKKLHDRLPYLEELGITYLHVMPLYKVPEANSDGGYAVSSFREVNPKFGTMADLQAFGDACRERGINLVLDFIFNHTSNEHTWAKLALAGDQTYQDYYYMFPDRQEPNQYEEHLREIFPDYAPGSFSYNPELERWIWTTFYPFQWDLNYRNPEVFTAMLGEMLFLANSGVDILRLDAVAFIWKQKGTSCENLPQAHWIIQAYNALVRLAAPGMVFKSEAIVHPDEVAKYFGEGDRAGEECPISYNPTLMALLWETLATREVKLLEYSMQHRFEHPENCAWVNYIRSHDDIGWSFADEDAYALHMNAFDHRLFLNQFYTNDFDGSFAKGVRFNFNPETLDARICGMLASLAGLEQAQEEQDDELLTLAIGRIKLLYGVIMSMSGIPLIYAGDELAITNDYNYTSDPDKNLDDRWVHRVALSDDRLQQRTDTSTPTGMIYQSIHQMIQVRKQNPIFSGVNTSIIHANNPHVFSVIRWRDQQTFLGIFNFSEHYQALNLVRFKVQGLPSLLTDALTGEKIALTGTYNLQPYQFLWLMNE